MGKSKNCGYDMKKNISDKMRKMQMPKKKPAIKKKK